MTAPIQVTNGRNKIVTVERVENMFSLYTFDPQTGNEVTVMLSAAQIRKLASVTKEPKVRAGQLDPEKECGAFINRSADLSNAHCILPGGHEGNHKRRPW